MSISEIFNREEHLILKLLQDHKLKNYDFKDINFERLIKIASSHLIIPLIYSKIKAYQDYNSIPKDFIEYVKNIFIINENRNKQLLQELKAIEKTLENHKINYKLIKGASFLKRGVYDNIGDRMIGDIDLLVKDSEIEKSKLALNKIGYQGKIKYKLWKTKHQPRLINSKKIFALEIHTEVLLFRHRQKLNSLKYLENDKKINDLRLIILNYQINDYGYLKASYSYRTIYDFIIFYEQKLIDKIKQTKEIRNFLFIARIMGLITNKNKFSFSYKLFLTRLKIKKRFKIYLALDNFICNILINIPIRIMQLLEFCINVGYRKNVLKKLFN